LPDIGEGLTEADIIEWFVAVGDDVTSDQAIVEIETAKTTVEITATHTGKVLALGGAPGDSVAVGDILFVIGEDSSQSERDSLPQLAGGDVPRNEGQRGLPRTRQIEGGVVRAMPIVRKLAKERGIDLGTVQGTGPRGAITRADIENHSAGEPTVELVAMGRKRRAIANHMSESWATIPHVTVQADVRAEPILEMRHNSGADPIPVEAIITQAVLPLLVRYKEFNATVRGDSIEYRKGFHIGIAVDTDDGLMVVVVRDADKLSLEQIADEIRRLAVAAQDGTLKPDEAIGQTFTISNIGALGGGHGTPIIPLGTSAILSIGRAHSAPVVENDILAVGTVAPIDLSYDHRLIDGGLGQQFLSDLIKNLRSTGSGNAEETP
jgi:pyruvate/2-oxoglutarate dehydrogenase complex dihydrolipoamide acyltransferase (E2) component